jgi:glycolate oxidase FAD binding subunit
MSATSIHQSPTTVAELAEIVRDARSVRVDGSGSQSLARLPGGDCEVSLSTTGLAGVLDFSPDDQVVSLQAGTSILELQRVLAERGQCLPLSWNPIFKQDLGTIGGALSMNLPHDLEAECGTWRDWVLGVTVVMADGTVAKSGSRAVKNVAGYDLQKLFIGARGTLGVIAEVILRTYPVASLPGPVLVPIGMVAAGFPPTWWIQRVLPSDLAAASRAAASLPGYDVPGTSTLLRIVAPDLELPRYQGDWVLRTGCGGRNMRLVDPTQVRLMQRTKDLFDPAHKLNPGEMGIF